jgi:pyruvate dehydrogenase E1 component
MDTLDSNGKATADIDAEETRDWLDSLDSVVREDGAERARFLVERLVEQAGRVGASPPLTGPTPYVNTIPADQDPPYPGDAALERRVRNLIRWNAVATVLQANKTSSELGGHIASYQSAATLYEVGFNHFWHAPSEQHGGDLVFMQGHSAPGFYARALLEGRLTTDQLKRFRQ